MDIRYPIGGLLALIGIMMAAHSFTLTPEELKRSLGMNVNLYWGAFMTAIGALFLLFARRAKS